MARSKVSLKSLPSNHKASSFALTAKLPLNSKPSLFTLKEEIDTVEFSNSAERVAVKLKGSLRVKSFM